MGEQQMILRFRRDRTERKSLLGERKRRRIHVGVESMRGGAERREISKQPERYAYKSYVGQMLAE